MKRRTKHLVNMFSLVFVVSATFLFLLTFFTAYASPEKAVTIQINQYGEADVEMFTIVPITVVSLFFVASQMLKELKLARDETE